MGGNALKDVERVDKGLYETYCREISDILPREFGVLTRFAIIPSYRSKKTFGDMDILVCNSYLTEGWRERLNAHFCGIGERNDFVKNGPVTSFNFNGFQIDIILSNAEDFDFSLGYFSWNDLGNLIGRVAHRHRFKFGHNGLWYIVRDGDYKVTEIRLTVNFFDALTFLGFDAEQWNHGFDDIEDIFKFVSESKYFKKDMYPLEHRSHRARIRDAKRKTYTDFLKWVDEKKPDDGVSIELFPKAHETFERFADEYNDAIYKLGVQRSAKSKFNGDIVSELTGLTGVELGGFMMYLRRFLPYCSSDAIVNIAEEDIRELIMEDFRGYSTNH